MGKGDNTWVIEMAIELGFKILADVGRRGLTLKDKNSIRYVIGTEYLEYPSDLTLLDNRVVSLDAFNKSVKFKNRKVHVEEVLERLANVKIRKLLVIDLSRVGTMLGPNTELISIVRRRFHDQLIVGGGIRNEDDIIMLKSLGVNGVLIATAIHKGIITKTRY